MNMTTRSHSHENICFITLKTINNNNKSRGRAKVRKIYKNKILKLLKCANERNSHVYLAVSVYFVAVAIRKKQYIHSHIAVNTRK